MKVKETFAIKPVVSFRIENLKVILWELKYTPLKEKLVNVVATKSTDK